MAEVDGATVDDVRRAALTMWNSLLLSVDPEGSTDTQLSWLTGLAAVTRCGHRTAL
jgi:hypothetical protein